MSMRYLYHKTEHIYFKEKYKGKSEDETDPPLENLEQITVCEFITVSSLLFTADTVHRSQRVSILCEHEFTQMVLIFVD